MKYLIMLLFSALVGCALVSKKAITVNDKAAWVGVPVQELEDNDFFSSGDAEIVKAPGKSEIWVFNTGYNQGVIRTQCQHRFLIENKTVKAYVADGNCSATCDRWPSSKTEICRSEATIKDSSTIAEQSEELLDRVYEKIDNERKRKNEELVKLQGQARQLGASVDLVKKAFGKPDREELMRGRLVYWYDFESEDEIAGEPTYFIFKNSRLESHFVDRETIAQRQQEAVAENNRRVAAETVKRQAVAAALGQVGRDMQESARQQQQFQQQLQQQQIQQPAYRAPVRCETRPNAYGGGSNTVCR